VGDSGGTQEHECYPRQIEPRLKKVLRPRGSEYYHLPPCNRILLLGALYSSHLRSRVRRLFARLPFSSNCNS
jgi:hypothetical protein